MYYKFRICNYFSFKTETMANALNVNLYEFIIKIFNMR